MNQQDIFTKVGNILSELNEQYQFLSQDPQTLNDLELELFLANADFLADHVRIIQKLNAVKGKDASTVQTVSPAHHSIPAFPAEPQEEVSTLAEIVAEEAAEERVDVAPHSQESAEEKIHEEVAEEILQHDFFKPDQDEHHFEFILNQHSENDQFDYEAKPVEEIFDRPLSEEEAEILAQKKRIHQKEEQAASVREINAPEEDEIGPEPFLISKADLEAEPESDPITSREEEKYHPEPAVETAPIPALRDVEMDEPIISPKVEAHPVFTPEAVPVKPVEKSVPVQPAPSLNELLAKTHAQSEQPVQAPIADLKQGINLNEKLLFIKDLFKGYNLAYSEAIDIINKMDNFAAADHFLQSNYAMKNEWASKQSTVDQFYELLNRRFSR